jgi:hypothetical protein
MTETDSKITSATIEVSQPFQRSKTSFKDNTPFKRGSGHSAKSNNGWIAMLVFFGLPVLFIVAAIVATIL